MSKAAFRVIQDSKHVGTLPRRTVADAVRTISRNAKTGEITVKRDRHGVRTGTKR